jgi:hypothetical protein
MPTNGSATALFIDWIAARPGVGRDGVGGPGVGALAASDGDFTGERIENKQSTQTKIADQRKLI